MSELKPYVLRGGVPENPDALRARIGELEEALKESISYLQLQGKYHSEPIKRFEEILKKGAGK